ncbi:MAG: hypothetical protein QOG67_512 [Verrucomicrobiota bacterium]|jgi:hypothetical protein
MGTREKCAVKDLSIRVSAALMGFLAFRSIAPEFSPLSRSVRWARAASWIPCPDRASPSGSNRLDEAEPLLPASAANPR